MSLYRVKLRFGKHIHKTCPHLSAHILCEKQFLNIINDCSSKLFPPRLKLIVVNIVVPGYEINCVFCNYAEQVDN